MTGNNITIKAKNITHRFSNFYVSLKLNKKLTMKKYANMNKKNAYFNYGYNVQ